MKKILTFFVLIGFIPVLWASTTDFKEGKHYQQVPFEILEKEPIQDLRDQYKNKILVIEFFSYGCHWCHQLEPMVEQWAKHDKPAYVEFIRVPVVFQNSWANFAKAYYTARDLDALDKIHPVLFDAVHNNEIRSSAPDVLQAFFAKHGIDGAQFAKTFDSFSVEQEFKRSNQISIAYRITSIPTFIIQSPDGALITSAKMAGGEKEVFEVINTLAQEEHKNLVASKDSH